MPQRIGLGITGQAAEAMIQGILCMVGMAVLRILCAPMIGALTSVTVGGSLGVPAVSVAYALIGQATVKLFTSSGIC